MTKFSSELFKEVYWIGGTSGAAKSTVARHIAERHDMELYSTDEVMGDHARRYTSQDCPLLNSFINMTMDERWVERTPKEMFKTFHWFHGEGFNLGS
jgi:adenylylsulfate kinase-like enzyme